MNFNGVSLEWLGHASFKLKAQGIVVYIDPFVLPTDAEKADIILLTHEHYDHCDPERIAEIQKPTTVIIGPKECAAKVKLATVVAAGGCTAVKGVRIVSVPAYNINKQFHTKESGKVGYVITFLGVTFYHAGDTDFIPEMKDLKGIDVAFLPIGGKYTMDVREAAEAAKSFKPKIVVPMHYNQIPGTKADPEQLKKLLAGTGIDVRVQ